MTKQTPDDKAFTQLDQDKFKQELKTEAVEAAKQSLIDNIQGSKPKYSWENKGKKAPSDYDELFDEVDKRVVKPEDIDKRVDEKLKARDDAELKKQEEARKQKDEEIKQVKESFDRDWYALVQEGKMPAPSDEIQEKINKGEKLSQDEIESDEGLKARLKLAKVSVSKSAKLAYYEDYSKEPAGAKAPVLGARPSSTQKDTKELEYEDVAENRKKIFGF